MKTLFNVTYEIVTQESAEHGDADERGYICENVKLRDAIPDFLDGRTARRDGGNGLEHSGSNWVTFYNGMEFETGAQESRSLHFPANLTPASEGRIMRYLEGKRIYAPTN